jgi:hypothetical protein
LIFGLSVEDRAAVEALIGRLRGGSSKEISATNSSPR